MRRLLALTLALALLIAPASSLAQAPADTLNVEVTRQSAEASFSESIQFALEFEAEQPVDEAILFLGVDGETLVRRIYVDHSPGLIDYAIELEPGEYPPGETLVYWWRLETLDGRSFETAPSTLAHDDDRFEWKTLDDGQLTLHWYGDRGDGRQAQSILDAGAAAVARLKSEMGVASEDPIHIWVYNTQRDMKAALTSRADAYDELIMTLGVAIGHDTLLLLGSDSNVEGTVAHELSHIVTHMAVDNPYSSIPRWLDEGLAMLAEDELPRDNQVALDRGIRNDDLLTVRSMTSYSGRAELVDLYYGEVYNVVAFMIETWGRDSITELLDTMAQGVPQVLALQAVYGIDLEELDALWRESLGLEPRQLPGSDLRRPSRLAIVTA